MTEYAEEDMLKQKKHAVTERRDKKTVLKKNRTEPVGRVGKKRGAEKNINFFIFTDIFFKSHARPVFRINIGLVFFLLFFELFWVRLSFSRNFI